jgi:hypothetical protein
MVIRSIAFYALIFVLVAGGTTLIFDGIDHSTGSIRLPTYSPHPDWDFEGFRIGLGAGFIALAMVVGRNRSGHKMHMLNGGRDG